jgi:hypothetical protein
MSFGLGFWAAAGAGGAASGEAYEQIATTLVSSTTGSVTFSLIPQTYKHLQLRWAGRDASTSGDGYIRFNSDGGNNYSAHRIIGGTGSVTSSSVVPASVVYVASMANTNDATSAFSAGVTDFLDYSSTTKNKTIRAFTGVQSTNKFIALWSGAWYNTNAISSMEFFSGGTGWISGTRISLYGIRG